MLTTSENRFLEKGAKAVLVTGSIFYVLVLFIAETNNILSGTVVISEHHFSVGVVLRQFLMATTLLSLILAWIFYRYRLRSLTLIVLSLPLLAIGALLADQLVYAAQLNDCVDRLPVMFPEEP